MSKRNVIEFAEDRLRDEERQRELGADNRHDIQYWAAYLDGAREQKKEDVCAIEALCEKMQEQADLYTARAKDIERQDDPQEIPQYTWAISLRETYRRFVEALDDVLSSKEIPFHLPSVLLFSHRLRIEKMFIQWCKNERVLCAPQTLVAFMQGKGWMNEQRVLADLKREEDKE